MGQSNSTVLRAGRFIALMLAALSLSLSMAHLLKLPQRMQFDQQLWVEVTIVENADRLFGSVGAGFDIGAILAAIGLAFLVRRRGAAFYWTLGGAVLLGLAFVGWLVFVVPMNAEFDTWLTEPVPTDWMRYRDQWEYAQAAIALIKTLGLSCLVISVLLDAPSKLANNSQFERPHQNGLPATTLSSAPARATSAWLWSVRLVGVIVVSAAFFGLITYVFHSVLIGTILSIAGILGLGSMDR
ncbi:hypothetical protein NC969_08085 [Leptolyngbya subtilissima ST-M1]|uniref:hypothetical protein n=1 Tax=Cyanophyceae TaxID=3028117 RepID=UPI0018EFF8A6|nr:hypothetical protein [Nodosilinea sp. FACHB-131]